MNRIGSWNEEAGQVIPWDGQPKRVVVTAVKVYDIEDVIGWIDEMDDPTTLAALGGKIMAIDDVISIVLDWAHDDLPEVSPNVELEF